MSPVATARPAYRTGRQLEMPVLSPSREGSEGPVPVAVAPSPKRVRADALPEFTRYRDDGCDIHPTCLSCPLPRCRYEEPGGLRALLNAYRDRQIVRLREKGVPVDDLAGRFSVSRRTVFRVLESRGGGERGKRAASATAPPIFLRRDGPPPSDALREAQCA